MPAPAPKINGDMENILRRSQYYNKTYQSIMSCKEKFDPLLLLERVFQCEWAHRSRHNQIQDMTAQLMSK